MNWLRKMILRFQYRKLAAEYDAYSCGFSLTDELRPDLAIRRRKLEEKIRKAMQREAR